jgi:hypothetical protein
MLDAYPLCHPVSFFVSKNIPPERNGIIVTKTQQLELESDRLPYWLKSIFKV